VNEGRELTGEKSVRVERDTKVLKWKASFGELGEAEDGLLYILRYTCKENRGFGCINYKARQLLKDSKLLKDNINKGHVTAVEQKNIISKPKMTDF
jgi:hypothetical protein